ncbi:MAG: hypothetical protein WCC12_15645, partial [Anaerolineales bacterium]
IQYTMGSTHTWNSVNYADAFNLVMTLTGSGLLLFGAGILVSLNRFRGTADKLIAEERPRLSAGL